jgi:hypothetical protein
MRGIIDRQKRQNVRLEIHKPRIARWRFRVVSISLILILLIEAFAIPAFSARGEPQQIEKSFKDYAEALLGLGELKKLSREQVADRFETLLEEIEKAKNNIPRDTFDIRVIVEQIGTDPIALFEWVRDYTFLIPYRGVLRGHQGVLMDRLGNSCDRALLLYSLLREAKKEVRLAHGSLSENQAEDVLKKVRPVPKGAMHSRTDSVIDETDALMNNYANKYRLDLKEIHEIQKKLKSRQKQFLEKVGKRVEEQVRDLSNRLGDPDKGKKKADFEAAINAVQDHWWVQWHDGSKWLDLDPALVEAEAGKSLIAPKETFKPINYSELRDYCHSIRIRMEIEYWEKGKLEKAEVLNQVMLPAVMFGKRIVLHHIPPAWSMDLTPNQVENSEEKLKKAVLNQREWLPIISVDADKTYKYSFLTDSKNIFDATLPGWAASALKGREVVDATKAGSEAAGNRLKNLLARRSKISKIEKSEKPTGIHLTAEWIEYEISVPGQEPQKIRREIFDLLGPARRASQSENIALPEITEEMRLERGYALLDQIEILPLVCQLSPEFVVDLMAEKMLANKGIFLNIIRNGRSSNRQELAEQLSYLTPLPGPGYSLALARCKWNRPRSDVYIDRPNILSYFRGIRQCPECQPQEYQGYDIVANEVAIHPHSKLDPFQARLEQGVLDTNAEAFLLRGFGKTLNNTAELFDVTRNKNRDWLTIRDELDSSWKEIALSEDIKERIKRELSAGYIAVVPKNVISVEDRDFFGWWRIDPKTGHTLGIGERGRGQTATEILILTGTAIVGYWLCVRSVDKSRAETDFLYWMGVVIGCGAGLSLSILTIAFGVLAGITGAIAGGIIVFLYGLPTIINH